MSLHLTFFIRSHLIFLHEDLDLQTSTSCKYLNRSTQVHYYMALGAAAPCLWNYLPPVFNITNIVVPFLKTYVKVYLSLYICS